MVDIAFAHGLKKNITALVDVGVGGASVCIIQQHGASSMVLATGHSALSLDDRSAKQAVSVIAQQVRDAADIAVKTLASEPHKPVVTNVMVVVHAPWARTETTAAFRQFEAQTVVHEAIIAGLAKDALAATTSIDPSKLLEASVTRVEIDGYHSTRPEGKKARRLDAVSLLSECDVDVKNSIGAVVTEIFPGARVSWRSGIRAIAAFIESTRLKGRDVFVVDISSDTSHLVSIRNGFFQQSLVAEGTRTILARLSGGRLPDETLGHMRMLEREACSNEACEAIEKAMGTAEPELARIFGEAIVKMSSPRHVPNNLVLVAHRDLQTWLSQFFTRIDFAQFTVTTLPFEVHTVDSLGGSISDRQTPAIAIDVALVNSEDTS